MEVYAIGRLIPGTPPTTLAPSHGIWSELGAMSKM